MSTLSAYSMHWMRTRSDESEISVGNSRNSRSKSKIFTGAKDEFLALSEIINEESYSKKDVKTLFVVFILMVFVGLCNKIFNKLMTIPMHNYPNFLNLLTTFIYIPVCFAYIIPMSRNGGIPGEQLELPKRPFAVMGGLDAMAGIMQIFSATYLPGPLLILLGQAAIPVSMIISRYLLSAKYNRFQYVGALIVAGGIITVLAPELSGSESGGNLVLWSCVMIASTVPMALSSVFKEIALGEKELDPIFLNGWVAIFQFLFALILCVPLSLASSPPVPIPDLPQNLLDGLKCYVGINSVSCSDSSDQCTKDNCNPTAPEFVTIYLFFNQLYNLLIILILKYGSANLLFMALTLMVPLGNVAFTLPFVPGHAPLRLTEILGLVIICVGLGTYRFAAELYKKYFSSSTRPQLSEPFLDQKQDLTSKTVRQLLNPVQEEDNESIS